MRDEENLFEGTTTVLSFPSELSELRPHDAALVSPRLRRLFADPPRSLRELASATSFAPLATWLRRMAKVGGCELVIDRPSRWLARRGMAPSVSLRVGAADAKVHLSGPLPRLPKRIPAALRDVLGSVGTVTLQYGAAGGLLAPREQRSLVDLYAEIVRNNTPPSGRARLTLLRTQYTNLIACGIVPASTTFESFAAMAREQVESQLRELRDLPRPPTPKAYFAFFQNAGGGYVTTNTAGETWHVPMGGGDYAPGPRIDAWLAGFFRPDFVF
ncbi:MAG: hypothetical protein JNM74_06375 [Myxococcales bacterium]|nr:hypothetical protein [Myxococcales bacterium]